MTLDLDGPEGNAFHLLGIALKFGGQSVVDKMLYCRSYEKLVVAFAKEFPSINLVTRDKDLKHVLDNQRK